MKKKKYWIRVYLNKVHQKLEDRNALKNERIHSKKLSRIYSNWIYLEFLPYMSTSINPRKHWISTLHKDIRTRKNFQTDMIKFSVNKWCIWDNTYLGLIFLYFLLHYLQARCLLVLFQPIKKDFCTQDN